MDNEAIARKFYRLAALMDIRGDDPFRLRSYRNAAEAIETWPTPLQKIAADEGIAGLQAIPGVGKAIAGKILNFSIAAPSTRGRGSSRRRRRAFSIY